MNRDRFRVWDHERKFYFRLLVIDFEKGEYTLTNGNVRVWRKFNEVTIEKKSPFRDIDGQYIFEGDYIGSKHNTVELCNGSWCTNGDRPLELFTNQKVVGNRNQGILI